MPPSSPPRRDQVSFIVAKQASLCLEQFTNYPPPSRRAVVKQGLKQDTLARGEFRTPVRGTFWASRKYPPRGRFPRPISFQEKLSSKQAVWYKGIFRPRARYFLYGQKVPKEPLGVGTGYFIPLPATPRPPGTSGGGGVVGVAHGESSCERPNTSELVTVLPHLGGTLRLAAQTWE